MNTAEIHITPADSSAPKPSLYQRLIAAGVPVSNYYSDLYFPANLKTRQILNDCQDDGVVLSRPTTFHNQVEGGIWYDAPFQFEPYWQAQQAKAVAA